MACGQLYGWAAWLGTLKEHNQKTDDKKGKDCTEVYKLIILNGWKIAVPQISAHQRVALAGKDFNNEVYKMNCSVDPSQFLSQVSPVTTQQDHEKSGHHGRDGGYAWITQCGRPSAKAELATAAAK